MSVILNLIRLDLYKLSTYRTWLLALLVFSLSCLFFPQGLPFFCLIAGYFVAATLIAVDEGYKSNYLYAALPLSRRQVVSGRYTFFLLMTVVLLSFYSALAFLAPVEKNMLLISLSLFACFAFNLIFLGFSQALCYRFKYNVVRMIMLVAYIVVFSAISGLANLLGNPTFGVWVIVTPPKALSLLTALAAPCFIVLALFTVSYLLALKLYARKDLTE